MDDTDDIMMGTDDMMDIDDIIDDIDDDEDDFFLSGDIRIALLHLTVIAYS